jgi:NDP-sugar pyrophosphorylase family protein
MMVLRKLDAAAARDKPRAVLTWVRAPRIIKAMTPPDLSPAAFFDLDGFTWRALFDEAPRAWDVLGRRLAEYLLRAIHPGVRGNVHPSAVLEGDDIAIGTGTVVEPGAYIQGPCIIGDDVEIRHGAYIRGNVIVGDGCVVGHATEVKGSVFLPGAKAGHFAYVGDSVLGRDVNLGAGTKLANLRLAGDEVCVRIGDLRVKTGLRKFGAILGDRVQTGCNSVTNPGTVLGQGALVHPCVAVGGFHAAGTVIAK